MTSTGILVLDLPQKTFVGINLTSFNSSPHFHGIINLPPGFHFLYTGTDASLSIRSGQWLEVSSQSTEGQIHVLRWDAVQENLTLLDPSSIEARSAVDSIPTLKGRGLVDYTALLDASTRLQKSSNNTADDIDTSTPDQDIWSSLTSHISSRTLSRILLDTKVQYSDSSSPKWAISSISSAPQDDETIPGLDTNESQPVLHDAGASTLRFVPINLKQTWPDDSVGRDRTDKARDKSWYLGHLISGLATATTPSKSSLLSDNDKRARGAQELLAELQFCFLMVLTLANYSALEQWKRILSVLFGCRTALDEVQTYFVEIVRVLRIQLSRVDDVDGGLFEMADDVGNQWLRLLLKNFRVNMDEVLKGQYSQGGLDKALIELEEWLREKYGWADDGVILKRGMVDLEDGERVELQMDGLDEEEESGEYAPVIVEM